MMASTANRMNWSEAENEEDMGPTKNDIQDESRGLNEFSTSVSAGEALRHGDMYGSLARIKCKAQKYFLTYIDEKFLRGRQIKKTRKLE